MDSQIDLNALAVQVHPVDLSLSLSLSLSPPPSPLSLSLSLPPSPPSPQPNCHQLGPKPFPLDRLMAIFYSIMEDSVSPSVHIYSQVCHKCSCIHGLDVGMCAADAVVRKMLTDRSLECP